MTVRDRSPDEQSDIRDSDRRLSPAYRHSRCEASAFSSKGTKGRLCMRATSALIRLLNSPASPCGLRRARPADTRHPPRVWSRPWGFPVVPHLPVGACGTSGAFSAPRRPHVLYAGSPHAACAAHGQWPSPTPKIVGLNSQGRGKQIFACVPRAVGLCGLLHVPGVVAGADAGPFVRAVARTYTGPSARVTGVCPRPFSRDLRSSLRPRSGVVAAIRIPLPRIEGDRNAPLTGAGCG